VGDLGIPHRAPAVVIQPTMGSDDVADGENRASTSVRMMTVSLDVVTFVKALSSLFPSLDSGYFGGNPTSRTTGWDDGGARRRYPS
jgi:hypothetical protein